MARRRRGDEDFASEVESHMQLEADRLVEEGMSPEAARFAAQKRFGNAALARERFYYSGRSLWFDQLKQDVSTAVRGIKRYPVACVIAIISLGGGIGATTMTLVLRNAVFLAAPPLYRDPADLYSLRSPTPDSATRLVPAGLLKTWLEDSALAGSLGASTIPIQQDVRVEDQLVSRPVRAVTPELFLRLGVRPELGVSLLEPQAGGEPPVILSAGVWRNLFQMRGDVIGTSIQIDGKPHTVVGVMPPRFWFGSMDGPVWTRLDLAAALDDAPLDVMIRRPAGLSETAMIEQLRAGADRFAVRLPADQRQLRVTATPLRGTPVGNAVGPFVIILLTSAVLLTLLIASTNVAVLMMAQWTSREHEIAIRASLGGSRGRIVRSLLTESTLIAGAGGLLGMALTFSLRGLAVRRVPTAAMFDLTIDWVVFLQSAIVTIAAGLLTGVAPALYETRRLHVNPLSAIRGSDRVRQRWRHALVVFEIAATVALLVSTGAMLASYAKSLNESPGFETRPIFSAFVDDPDGINARIVLERLRTVPGVAAAEVTTTVPFLAMGQRQPVSSDAAASATIVARGGPIGPAYFSTLGVAMKAGRMFDDGDAAGGSPVAVVNAVLAEQFWPGAGSAPQSAIGRQIWVDGAPRTVVGVVAAYSMTAIRPAPPLLFTPFAQLTAPPTSAQFMIRATGEPAPLTQTVRRELAAMGGSMTVVGVTTIDQIRQIIGQEILVGTFPLFPLIATGMLLTAAGIYGVLAFAVSRRATELAVRMAIGATGHDLLRLVAAHSLRMLGLGTAIGISLTFALTRVAQGRGGVFDSPGWQAFVLPMILIGAIGAIATLIPMRRALRINPASLLRTT